MRDEFSEQVKANLYKRVAGRCSNPACLVATTGPNSNPEKIINLGVAAHITAASPDGPRYDSLLSAKTRKAISNGIWLCQTCAKLVDSDSKSYTVETLRDWKARAEQKASRDLGAPPLELSMLRSNRLGATIHSLLSAAKNRYEALDKRINIDISYTGESLHYIISAKEPFSAKMILRSAKDNLVEKMRLNFEEGEKVHIELDEFAFEGSKALEELLKEKPAGLLVLGNKDINCKLRLQMTTKRDGLITTYFDAILRGGSKRVRCFNADSNSPINFEFSFIKNGDYSLDGFSCGVDFSKWNNTPLLNLADYDLALNLFGEDSSDKFEFRCEIGGKSAFSVTIEKISDEESAIQLRNTLIFIGMCKRIATHFHVKPTYADLTNYSKEEIERIQIVYGIIKDGHVDVPSGAFQFSASIQVSPENINILKKGTSSEIFKIIEEKSEVRIFDKVIDVGRISYSLTKPTIEPKVASNKIKLGKNIRVEITGQDEGSLLTIGLLAIEPISNA